MKTQPISCFWPGVNSFAIWKPYLFRAPKYQWAQKNISDTNIRLLSSHIGKKVIIPNQNHSTDIEILDKDNRDGILEWDAIITQLTDVVICVIASDCVPIILYDRLTESIWVIHAGRKWLEWGIISQCITSMNTIFSAKSHTIQAYIWACISQYKYELGWEEVKIFQQNYPSCVKPSLNNSHKYLLDVWAIAHSQLEESGIKPENISLSGECTYTESKKYHSYRRNTHSPESDYWNNIFGICLN